jgi:hypothetical protein
MKKHRFTLLGLGLLLLGASAYAQTVNMKVAVPFSFIVNGAKLPSGAYLIRTMGSTHEAISIGALEGKAGKLLLTHRCESRGTPDKSKLVFHRYGDRYFLAQIWMAGSNSGRELPKSRQEREVALDYTAENVVLVAALR